MKFNYFPSQYQERRLMQTGRPFAIGAQIVRIGLNVSLSWEEWGNFFEGTVDNFALFSDVLLSQNQIARLLEGEILKFHRDAITFSTKFNSSTYLVRNANRGFMYHRIRQKWLRVQAPESFLLNYDDFHLIQKSESSSQTFYVAFKSRLCKDFKFDQDNTPQYIEIQKKVRQLERLRNLHSGYIPIILTAYKRYDLLLKVLTSFQQADNIQNTIIFISQDGNDAQVSDLIREFSQKLNLIHIFHQSVQNPWPDNKTYPTPNQFHCANNVYFILNLTLQFLNYKTVIYTEDDFVFAPDFYTYSQYVQDQFLYNDKYDKRFAFATFTNHPKEIENEYQHLAFRIDDFRFT